MPQPKGGSRKGVPNKIGADVKAMVLEALKHAGGAEYLFTQAFDNPKAFLALVGKVLPLQITGENGAPILIAPASMTDEQLAEIAMRKRIVNAPDA